jgi:NAD+ synthase (glutamine-hydrolysing)
VSGYGCEDHFFEQDTVRHSWQTLAEILADKELTHDILCDIGMPVHYNNTLYNCRVLCLNQKILLIRPKLFLAGGNNYREGRWFTPWQHSELVQYKLQESISSIAGQESTVFGNAVIECNDTSVACETCEELWVPKNPHVDYGLDGVEIIGNGSGSHHELRKLNTRLQLIRNATSRNGGAYLYSNLKGCDGGRVLFDGSSLISMNGVVYGSLPQFSIGDVEVKLGVLDLDMVRSKRAGNPSRGIQSSMQRRFPRVRAPIDLTRYPKTPDQKIALQEAAIASSLATNGVNIESFGIKLNSPMEEIA